MCRLSVNTHPYGSQEEVCAGTSAHLWSFPNHIGLNRHVLHRESRVHVQPILQRNPGGGRPQKSRAAQTLPGVRIGRVCARLLLCSRHTGLRKKFQPRGSTHRAQLFNLLNLLVCLGTSVPECRNTQLKLSLMSAMSASRQSVVKCA